MAGCGDLFRMGNGTQAFAEKLRAQTRSYYSIAFGEEITASTVLTEAHADLLLSK
jgi:hypothetical protein